MRSEGLISRRMSSRSPRGSERRRREARSGRLSAIAAISRRTRRYSSGVISAKSLSRSSSWPEAPSSSGSPISSSCSPPEASESDSPIFCCSAGRSVVRTGGSTGARRNQASEGAVEEIELVLPRDERLPEREVDVLLARQIDLVEATERIRDATRADLETDLAQDAAEGDDVADDRVGHRESTGPLSRGRCRRVARASRRAPPRCPRGT